MGLDMIKVGRGLESVRIPVQLPQPPVAEPGGQLPGRLIVSNKDDVQVYGRVAISNCSEVALEMSDVYWIKSNLECKVNP